MEMTKKIRIRVWIVVVITCVMCFSDWSFAADTEPDDMLKFMWYSLNYIVSVLWWIWLLFAKLAGIFLTNRLVYAESLWLDGLLWKYWNVVKNLANFWLWFYFVYVIFKWLIKQWKESITENLKKIILWILIAWVGIQSSWFLTAAVLDLSTITLAAAWAFPSQVISETPSVEESIKTNIKDHFKNGFDSVVSHGKEINLFPDGSLALTLESKDIEVEPGNGVTSEQVFDSLMPNANDISGPLDYLWLYILHTYEVPSISDSDGNARKFTILNTVIEWCTTIIYSIEMFVLCILAIMRIVYLWMFIVLSPIAVLLWCVEQSWQKLWDDAKSSFSKFMNQINLKSFLINAFKPTIIVLWLGVAILFVSLMGKVVNDSESRQIDMGWTTITSTKNGDPGTENPWDQTYNTIIDNNMIRFTLANVWKTFMDILLAIITVLLVYYVIEIAVKMWDGKDFVSQKIWKVQDEITWALGSMPIIPVTWYDKDGVEGKSRWIGADKIFNVTTWESELLNRTIAKYQWEVDNEYHKQLNDFDKWFDKNNTRVLESRYHGDIENSATWKKWLNVLTAQIDKIREIWGKSENDWWLPSGYWYGMILNPSAPDTYWQWRFKAWLIDMKDKTSEIDWPNKQIWINMINWWNSVSDTERTLENLFKKNKSGERESVRAYAELFNLRLNSNTWTDLMDVDFSEK